MTYLRDALVLGVLTACGAAPLAAATTPTVDDLAAVLWRYNEQAEVALPIPSREQLAELAGERTVALRERTPMHRDGGDAEDRIRVLGYRLVRRPRLLVWLATLKADAAHSRRLTEHLVHGDDAGGSVWYQHLDTPWPVRNRHWVIRNSKNVVLADATRGLVWEHRWQLESGGERLARELLDEGKVAGLDARTADSAIYLSINRGAWTMFALGDDATLVVAHTTAVMGGWIPERWVAGFVSRQLGQVLDDLTPRADRIDRDYTGEYVIFGGDGTPITLERAREAARRHRQGHGGGAPGEPAGHSGP